MQKPVVSVLMLGAVLGASLQRPEPVRANPVVVQAAIATCAAQPELCAIVVAGTATWVLWSNGTKLYCTYATCQRTNAVPRESRIRDDLTNEPGVRETHYATHRTKCDAMAARFKQQGLRLKLRVVPNPMPGNRTGVLCVFEGPDADPNRYADPRSGSDR